MPCYAAHCYGDKTMARKETKYVVIKIDDIRNRLSQTEKYILEMLLQQIDDEREKIGKPYNEYIVCNKDEPYAENVWQAILDGEDSKAASAVHLS